MNFIKKYFYPISVFLAGCLWGTSGIFVRDFEESGVTMPEIVFIRAIFSAIVILGTIAIINPTAYKVKLKHLWIFAGTGIMGILGTSFTYFTTIEQSSMSFACIMMYTAPIFVAVFSRLFFKEKFTVLKIVCLAVTFIGCVLCAYEKGGFSAPFHVILIGLGSGLTYASYSIFTRFAINNGYKSETILVYTFSFFLVGSVILLPHERFFNNVINGNVNLLTSVGVGIIATALPYLFFTIGLKGVENGKASIISCIEIVSATVIGLIAYKEIPSVTAIMGMILVVGGVVEMNLKSPKPENKPPEIEDTLQPKINEKEQI